ncbi:hypothetical protein TRE132_08760 [Pseudomonas chlororaphis subsp. aurantiaca]|nr:hypothetical protein TRE132_08760 [Pseudomonas chlororaphis subsp. aurantiaca]
MKPSKFSLTLLFSYYLSFASATLAGEVISLEGASIDPKYFSGPARQIMRLSDGRIYATLMSTANDGSKAQLFAAQDGKSSWVDVSGALSKKQVTEVASDTGPLGTYIAYVGNIEKIGYIAHFPDPIGNPGKFNTIAVTPKSALLTGTVIATSKGDDSINSTVYGWLDSVNKKISIGISQDGKTFGKIKEIVSDNEIASGPSLAIHNKYILVSYLTRNKSIMSANTLDKQLAALAFVESWDGGRSWTSPRPVLGDKAEKVKIEAPVLSNGMTQKASHLYANGGARDIGNSLAWPKNDLGARIFVLSEQAVISDSTETNETLRENRPFVAILNFKDLSDGPSAKWNHVVASEYQPNLLEKNSGQISSLQYSALPGTSLRAVAYRERAAKADRIAVSLSVNTGKTFDKVVKFDPVSIGVAPSTDFSFTTSSCLRRDSKGDVFLDILIASSGNKDAKFESIPVDINLRDLPASMFNTVPRWP